VKGYCSLILKRSIDINGIFVYCSKPL